MFITNSAMLSSVALISVSQVLMAFADLSTGCLLSSYARSEEHTSELQSRLHLVCRLLLEKKKNNQSLSLTSYASSERPPPHPTLAAFPPTLALIPRARRPPAAQRPLYARDSHHSVNASKL